MNGESLYSGTDYFRPFPDSQDVFDRDVKAHFEYLIPVATVALEKISSDWIGDIHFIMPVEPVGGYGYLGEESLPYHNYLCRSNWLGYRLQNNKCELACDFKFFHKAYYEIHPPENDHQKKEAKLLDSHYKSIREYFANCKDRFEVHGRLVSDPTRWNSAEQIPDEICGTLVRKLGGISFDSNWCVSGFPVSRYPVQHEGEDLQCVLPKTEDGRDFVFIGEIELWEYQEYSNGALLLFYDPVQNIALTTIDWG